MFRYVGGPLDGLQTYLPVGGTAAIEKDYTHNSTWPNLYIHETVHILTKTVIINGSELENARNSYILVSNTIKRLLEDFPDSAMVDTFVLFTEQSITGGVVIYIKVLQEQLQLPLQKRKWTK